MMRKCEVCDGVGSKFDAFDKQEVKCRYCESGFFKEVDIDNILSFILAGRGKNKGKLRSSMTSPLRSEGISKNRAYYVWRWARFHGGADTTFPIMASFCVKGDPFKGELDSLADQVAKTYFGSDRRGALRWGRALGYLP